MSSDVPSLKKLGPSDVAALNISPSRLEVWEQTGSGLLPFCMEKTNFELVEFFIDKLNKKGARHTEQDKLNLVKCARTCLEMLQAGDKIGVGVIDPEDGGICHLEGTETLCIDREDRVPLNGRFLLFDLATGKELEGGAA